MLSPLAMYMALVKAIIGAGVLAMPYAMLRAGLIPSMLLLALIWMATVHTTLQLLRSALALDFTLSPLLTPTSRSLCQSSTSCPESESDVITYMQLSQVTFGVQTGRYVAWSCLVPAQFVTGTSYIIFVSQNTASALGGQPTGLVLLASVVISMAICTPRTMDYLAVPSTLGNASFLVAVLCVIIYAVGVYGVHEENVNLWGSWGGFCEAFGVLCLTFSAQSESLSILSSASAESRKNLTSIVVAAMGTTLVVFSLYSYLVLAAFGNNTQMIVFDNLPKRSCIVAVVRLAMSFMLQCSYPLALFPVFHIMETTYVDAHGTWSRLASRWTVVLGTATSAYLFMDYFEPIAAIVGGLMSTNAFMLPPLFYHKLKVGVITEWDRWTGRLWVLLGFFGSVSSILGGLNSIFNNVR